MRLDGLLVVDKPAGPTSHDVVARTRRALGERRIGHTGTLDPAATGVLPLVLGRATRLAQFLTTGNKTYEATVRLGFATDTYDGQGTPVGPVHRGPWPSLDAIDRVLDAFRGTFVQGPPAFSAKKIGGKRSYKVARARAGREGILSAPPAPPAPPALPAPVPVTASSIDIVDCDGDMVRLRIHCSAGFYVRALAHDVGEQLGIGGHLTTLRRLRSGNLTLEDAVALEVIERERREAGRRIIPLSRMLPGLRAVILTTSGVRCAVHGRELRPTDTEKGVGSLFPELSTNTAPGPFFVRLLDSAGELVGIAEPSDTPGLLHPTVVLV